MYVEASDFKYSNPPIIHKITYPKRYYYPMNQQILGIGFNFYDTYYPAAWSLQQIKDHAWNKGLNVMIGKSLVRFWI